MEKRPPKVGPLKWIPPNLVYTAPVFAPLLFVNLALLCGMGLVGLRYQLLRLDGLAGSPTHATL